MDNDEIQLRGQYNLFSDKYDILITSKTFNKTFIAQPLIMEEVSNNTAIKKPTLSINRDSAQEFFNFLWNHGLRPKDGTGNGGHIEAIKYHLEDMRKLVFKDKDNG